jgi:2-keto-4-pentenoate hydratase
MEERLRSEGLMGLPKNTLYDIAECLHQAEVNRTPIDSLLKKYPEMKEEDSYVVQMIQTGRALRDGRKLMGYKVGLTSREAQKQFQVFEPDFGHLFNDMLLPPDGALNLSTLIQPKIEGEIAFVLGKDLRGPGITLVDVMGAVEYATAAVEIIDSRIKDWKITAVDTIADNGSSALFALSGKQVPLRELDLPSLGMALSRNGEVMVTGSGAACMGNPLNAVVFLANTLAKHDRFLLAGEVILSGSLGPMISMKAGDFYDCEIWKLGRISVKSN